MSADAAHGGMAAFIPESRKPELYARLYALGYSQVDVYEMSAATVLDIVARGESKAERAARLESEAEAAGATEVMTAVTPSAGPAAARPEDKKPHLGPPKRPITESEREAIRILGLCKSPIHPIVDTYARVRGVEPFAKPVPAGVGFVPTLEHKPSGHFLPALAFRFTDKNNAPLNAISVVYLEPSGKSKAKFPDGSGHKPTMMFGSIKGAAIRLAEAVPGKPVVITEGPETGLTILQATGLPVWVAGGENLGSFEPPDGVGWFVIAAENDVANKRLIEKCRKRLGPAGVRIDVAQPPVGTKDGPISDFNDLVNGRGADPDTGLPFPRERGLRRIKEIFEKTIAGETSKAREGDEDDSRAFSMTERGLWRRTEEGRWEFISAPFEVLGLARSAAFDGKVSGWGRLIKFANPDNAIIEEVVPSSALQGDPATIAGTLADLGFTIEATGPARRSFVQYLNRVEAKARITLASRTGWVTAGGGKLAFIVPGAVIGGDPNERVVLSKEINAPYGQHGTLEEWKEKVAKPAADHLMLRFAVGVSLGGPLIAIVGGESGVFHFYGRSTAGKTTAARVAASAWGPGADGGYVRTWRSTSNALESTLAASSDSLLVLDEIGQADPREIGQTIYMIANSRGKERLTKAMAIRSAFKWRTLVLSTGETTVAARLSENALRGGRQGARAGHLVRAIDISAANRTYGVFDDPGYDFDPETFADRMKTASSRFYGTLGPEFVRQLLDRGITPEAISEKIDAFTTKALDGVNDASGQVKRVAQRLGLVVAASELAAGLGLVPWEKDVPAADGVTLFKSWLSARGGAGQIEDKQMLAQVQQFFEMHGESRFDSLDDPPKNAFTGLEIREKPSPQRAGYREGEGEDRRWYAFPQVWRSEICAGHDHREVARLLVRLKIMEKGDGKNLMKQVRIGPGSRPRFYVVTPKIFEGWSDLDARNGVDKDDE